MPRTPADRRAAWRRGRSAEAFVAKHLQAEGWQVLVRNWSGAGGEIDLVVQREGALRVVEVRARQAGDPSALESVGPRKRRRLIRATEAWLLDHGAYDEVAFLVAVVTIGPQPWSLELVDDAFDG